LSGFLYAIAIVLPFALNSLGFLIAAVFVFLIPAHLVSQSKEMPVGNNQKITFVGDIKFGLAYLWNDKKLRNLVIFGTSVAFFFSLATSTMILFITETLGVDPKFFGIFMAITGVGAIVSSLVTPALSKKLGRGNVLSCAIVAASVTVLLQGLSSNIWIFTAIGFISAFVITNWNILLMSSYQVLIPSELYGRIHGARRTFVWGVMPIGAFIGGVIAREDLRLPLLVGGIATTIISTFSFSFINRLGRYTSQEDQAAVSQD
jgi:Na+/melibiose symporter-like transporter